MGLTNHQMKLIQSIAQNDMTAAKKFALCCLDDDTTAKNKYFCNRYKEVLKGSEKKMVELPPNLKMIMHAEDLSESFNEKRYHLSSREQKVFEKIVKMNKVSERLLQMKIPYLNSTLLYGESGTGKTTFGKYVAYKLGIPFVYINFSNLVDSYMGSTSKNISNAFSYATTNPCLFMLDEIDCISIRRSGADSSSASGEMARITISLLQEFDKVTNSTILIGATNRVDRIDEALLRRFSLKHEVKQLSLLERHDLVEEYLLDVGIVLPETERIEIINSNKNQAVLLNELIRKISEKIVEEKDNE